MTNKETALQQKTSAVIIDTRKSAFAKLSTVPIDAWQLRDDFWAPRRETNRRVTLPSQFAMCEETGRIGMMRRAHDENVTPSSVGLASDSDVYKWLEGASYQLATSEDENLRAQIETVIEAIEKMQRSDGYLHSYYDHKGVPSRYADLSWSHELYCFGHFMQAAVAHFRATASTRALDVAVKLANHVVETFGEGENQKRQTDGHEEIELGLIELFRATGDEKYLRQAQFFIDVRGQGTLGKNPYWQDDVPLREMQKVKGHAVRAAYFFAGATDLFLETGDETLKTALQRLWRNMMQQKMYVSGGIGARHEGEAFGDDYELPNARAYAETCAAIAVVMWAFRLLHVEPLCEYSDVLEQALYNGVLSGLAFDGEEYFYVNPLQNDGSHRREKWYETACCPPNLARLVAQVPGYFFSTNREGETDAVWVHLYAAGEATIELPSGAVARFSVETAYPFDGDVRFTLLGDGEYSLRLRIPAWCEEAKIVVKTAGETRCEYSPPSGEYFSIARNWKSGDVVELSLAMPARLVRSHPHVTENTGRVAVMRGPLLYCAEQIDNPGIDLRDVVAPAAETFQARRNAVLSVVCLHAPTVVANSDSGGALYRAASTRESRNEQPTQLAMIPYFAWANREPGAMQVWLRET